jgi:hypothetical protein
MSPAFQRLVARPLIGLDRHLSGRPHSLAAPRNLMLPKLKRRSPRRGVNESNLPRLPVESLAPFGLPTRPSASTAPFTRKLYGHDWGALITILSGAVIPSDGTRISLCQLTLHD